MLLILEHDQWGVFKFGSNFFSHALFACLPAGRIHKTKIRRLLQRDPKSRDRIRTSESSLCTLVLMSIYRQPTILVRFEDIIFAFLNLL